MSDHQAGFRAQQRFSDPAESDAAGVDRPDTAERVAAGLYVAPAGTAARRPPPYLDLSTVALLGQPKRAPSQGWRKWLYFASFKLINVGESPKVNRHNNLVAQVQAAAARLLPDRAAVAEGRRRQDDDHRDAGRDVRLDPR